MVDYKIMYDICLLVKGDLKDIKETLNKVYYE